MDLLHDKTALICGSTQGIGWATAQLFAQRGANVVLLARNEEKLQMRVRQLSELSPSSTHRYIVADFSQPDRVRQELAAWVKQGNTVHILVNNTGGPKSGPIIEASSHEFIDAFQQHLICNHILVQALYKGMKDAQFGRIINVISTSVKQPIDHLGVSNTIRSAVASWAKTLSNELGRYGITVNNVLPGATNTERLQEIARANAQKNGITLDDAFAQMAQQIPLKRIAQATEIAQTIAFLASDRASYINGVNIPVDGGRTKSL